MSLSVDLIFITKIHLRSRIAILEEEILRRRIYRFSKETLAKSLNKTLIITLNKTLIITLNKTLNKTATCTRKNTFMLCTS